MPGVGLSQLSTEVLNDIDDAIDPANPLWTGLNVAKILDNIIEAFPEVEPLPANLVTYQMGASGSTWWYLILKRQDTGALIALIQGGIHLSSASQYNIGFPVAYPVRCMSCNLTMRLTQGDTNGVSNADCTQLSGPYQTYTPVSHYTIGSGVNWIAIGY